MINPHHQLSLTRQAKLLNISRSSLYYKPRPISEKDQAVMHRIDKLHLAYPFCWSANVERHAAIRRL